MVARPIHKPQDAVLPASPSKTAFLAPDPYMTRAQVPEAGWRWTPLAVKAIWVVLWVTLLCRASLDRPLNALDDAGLPGLGLVINLLIVAFGLVAAAIAPRGIAIIALVAWLPYLAWMLVALGHTTNGAGGVRLYWQIVTLPAIFLMAAVCTASGPQLQTLLRIVLLSVAVPLAFALIQWLRHADDRTMATFTHPNILASYLPCVLAITPWMLKRGSGRRSPGYVAMVLLAAAAASLLLLGTETRSAWAVAALIFLLACVMVERKAFLLLPLGALVLLAPPVQKRLSDVSHPEEVPAYLVTSGEVVVNSYTWRKTLWRDALDASKDNRTWGKGLGAFNADSADFFSLNGATKQRWDAHSAYVQILYESGYFGVVTYLWLWLAIAAAATLQSLRGAPVAYPVYALVLTQLVIGYSDNILFYLTPNWYCWGLIGAFLGAGWARTQPAKGA